MSEKTKKLTKAQQAKLDAETAIYKEYAEDLGIEVEALTAEQKVTALKEAEEDKPAPNIAHAANQRKLVNKFSIGVVEIELPERQSRPFYHKDAALIIKTFPHLYKAVKPKG